MWAAWRWLGFGLGIWRLRSFPRGPVRDEARRTVIGRGAYNVFVTVIVTYVWASELAIQPGEAFVGFLAAAMMCSLAIAIAAGFMQPQERTPGTLDVCRVRRPKSSAQR